VFKGVVIFFVGKSAENGEPESSTKLRLSEVTLIKPPRKTSKARLKQPVPQTDTGSRDEYSKALG
jgi:hypothetical protein